MNAMRLFICIKTVFKKKKLLIINRWATYNILECAETTKWFVCIWLKPHIWWSADNIQKIEYHHCEIIIKKNKRNALCTRWPRTSAWICFCLPQNHIHADIQFSSTLAPKISLKNVFKRSSNSLLELKNYGKALVGSMGLNWRQTPWGSSPGHWVV